jgi:hypothetical protein
LHVGRLIDQQIHAAVPGIAVCRIGQWTVTDPEPCGDVFVNGDTQRHAEWFQCFHCVENAPKRLATALANEVAGDDVGLNALAGGLECTNSDTGPSDNHDFLSAITEGIDLFAPSSCHVSVTRN